MTTTIKTLELIPDVGVPYEPAQTYTDLVERATAACNTLHTLEEYGAAFPIEEQDKDEAATLALAYAEDPEAASKSVTNTKAAAMRPASILLASDILKEFSHTVVTNSVHIRNLVTNKLLLETENKDPRIRLRAMEMLGKITDVGLFTEKSEVTVTHQSSTELRSKLKSKLHRLIDADEENSIIDVVADQ